MRMRRTVTIVVLVLSAAVAAAQIRNVAEEDRQIEAKLATVSPAVVQTFHDGTIAYRAGDYGRAAELLRAVVAAAPSFSPGFRRYGYSLARLGRRGEGIKYAEQAVALERSAENLITVAMALEIEIDGKQPPRDDLLRALGFATEASNVNHDVDPEYIAARAQLALNVDRLTDFRDAAAKLTAKYPDAMATHYFAAIRAAKLQKAEQPPPKPPLDYSAESPPTFLGTGWTEPDEPEPAA